MTDFFNIKHPYIFAGCAIILGLSIYAATKAITKMVDNVMLVTIELNKRENEKTTEEK